MHSRTEVMVLPVPRENVFRYLSSVHNLPRWATEFCGELKLVDGKHKVVTCSALNHQELFVQIRPDEKTGVIDMLAGPTEDRMAIFPSRVLELANGSSAFIFTMFQSPETDDEQFEMQYRSLQKEFENVRRELMAE